MDEKRLAHDIDNTNNIRQKYQTLKLGVKKKRRTGMQTYKTFFDPLTRLSEKPLSVNNAAKYM